MNEQAPYAELVVDAHHHLWRYQAAEFDWIDDRMAMLQRDFTAEDLHHAMSKAEVDLSIAVQARQSIVETRMLLSAAAESPRIAAVVGWLPLTNALALDRALGEFAGARALAGVRHVVQAEPPGFLDDPGFNAGIRTVTGAGLSYDLLVRADQLREAARFADRHPETRCVLDHIAKPLIAASVLEPWGTEIRELARRPNVFCKLSGLVTEAAWNGWSLAALRPYLDMAVEAFGTGRLMVGSDWPVCLVASGYAQWWATLRTYFEPFSADERTACFGGNALRFYRVDVPPSRARARSPAAPALRPRAGETGCTA